MREPPPSNGINQKNPRAHKNKIDTSPPQVFLQKERIFPGVHKIGAAISGPRIADTNFTDTRLFLNKVRKLRPKLRPRRS